MPGKLRSWNKLLTVQRQFLRLAEARLAELHARERALLDSQRELEQPMVSDDRLIDLVIDHRSRRLRALAKELSALRVQIAAAEALVLDHAKRRRGIEQRVDSALREHRSDTERSDLNEAIDAALARDSTSLP